MADLPIGYYVHHHGTGHMQRALQISSEISRPVVLFSSRKPTSPLPDHVTYIELPSDIVGGYNEPVQSTFHYTPWSPITFARYKFLIESFEKHGIKDLYVDVSTEVALFAKLLGLRVGHALMHGTRTDSAHTRCYEAVDFLLSHNSQQFDVSDNRNTNTPVYYSGGISRFEKFPATKPVTFKNALLICSPATEIDYEKFIASVADSLPHTQWNVIGINGISSGTITYHGSVDNLANFFKDADFIIGAGGNNTIMEAASWGKPFICMPEDRPYNEQRSAAQTLQNLNAAVYLSDWPKSDEWPLIIKSLNAVDLDAFQNLVDDAGAKNAANIIEQAFQR